MAVWVLSLGSGQAVCAMEVVAQRSPGGDWEDVEDYERMRPDALVRIDRILAAYVTGPGQLGVGAPRLQAGGLDVSPLGTRRPVYMSASALLSQLAMPVAYERWIAEGCAQYYGAVALPASAPPPPGPAGVAGRRAIGGKRP